MKNNCETKSSVSKVDVLLWHVKDHLIGRSQIPFIVSSNQREPYLVDGMLVPPPTAVGTDRRRSGGRDVSTADQQATSVLEWNFK